MTTLLKDFSQQSSILVPAIRSLLSRQLNDCMCFLIYCMFCDYVQGSFKRMTSISDSWWSQEGATENSCFNLAVHLFVSCSNNYHIIHQDNAKWLSSPVWSTNESVSPSNSPVKLSTNSKINYKKRALRYVTLKDYYSQLVCTMLASLFRCLCARTRVLWHNFWGSLSYQA